MKRLVAALAAFAVATPAFAAVPVTLKANMVDTDGIVTLGEMFDGAGAAGRTPVASRTGNSVMLNAAIVRAAAARAGLDWANAEGLKQIVVSSAPTGVATNASGAPSSPGAARGNVDVLTWARSLSAGEMIQPQDVVWGKAALAPADAIADPDAVVGQQARRALRAGSAVAGRDVAALQVIKANEMVTLTFDSEGVSLALQGKALSGGAVGEPINVQNLTSKKIVQAVVTGPGQAAVGPMAEQLKLARSSRYALR